MPCVRDANDFAYILLDQSFLDHMYMHVLQLEGAATANKFINDTPLNAASHHITGQPNRSSKLVRNSGPRAQQLAAAAQASVSRSSRGTTTAVTTIAKVGATDDGP